MSLRRSMLQVSSVLIVLALLTACNGTATPTAPAAATPTLEPTITTTPPPPPRILTVCLGQEPASLFPVDNPSSAARSVLAGIYDGPVDTNSYGYQPVILQTLPSQQNGDAQLFQTAVYVGDEVVDATGTPVTLTAGTMVRPAGCRSDTCAVKYNGTGSIQMDQMQVTFRLLPGLTWSDGEPLTSADSVYAYQLSADPATTGSKYLVDRTKSYEAADDQVVQWWGKPGFVDPTYVTNFWSPLPKHLWGSLTADEVVKSEDASRAPVGWGPYMLQEWVAGDHITLTKNPHYFRASEGLPKFSQVAFRFVLDPNTAISDLIAGTCDILDPSIHLDGQANLLSSMAEQKQLQALFTTTPTMEQLAFGIRPAAYDNGFSAGIDRPDYFGDVRTRQAVALCLDRQKVVDTVLSGLSSVPSSYIPAQHPFYNPDVIAYSLNVSEANALLEQAGWKDLDNDPATPRLAYGVANVPNNTPFEVNYITTNAVQRQQVSSLLVESLAQCGIKVNVQYLDQAAFYGLGPAGPLFGRNFDLAEFAMGNTGIESPCDWFTSPEVPNAANHWVGTNVSGYSNPAFDESCSSASQSLPDETIHLDSYRQAQSIFAQDLPAIPLYWRVKVAAARYDFCNFSLDPTAASSLWNIENFDSGKTCLP